MTANIETPSSATARMAVALSWAGDLLLAGAMFGVCAGGAFAFVFGQGLDGKPEALVPLAFTLCYAAALLFTLRFVAALPAMIAAGA